MMRKKIKIVTLIFIGIVLFLSVGYCNAEKEKWPAVEKLQKSMYFEDARKAEAAFTIFGVEGPPLYYIECHTWEFTWNYKGNPDFDYSGDFECRLTSLHSLNTHSTLFTDNPKATRDWESRARFLVEELQGKCGDYPEYGRVRHFRLRGMKITLTINDLKIKTSAVADVVTGKSKRYNHFVLIFQLSQILPQYLKLLNQCHMPSLLMSIPEMHMIFHVIAKQ